MHGVSNVKFISAQQARMVYQHQPPDDDPRIETRVGV
jgi:hypothetical protein